MKRTKSAGMALAAGTLVLLAVIVGGGPARSVAKGAELAGETMRVKVERAPFSLKVEDLSGKTLLETDGPLSYTSVKGQRVSHFILWWFWTRGFAEPRTRAGEVVDLRASADSVEVDLAEKAGGPALVRMTAKFVDNGVLKVEMEVLDPGDVNRFRVRFKRDQNDRYYGMGERFNAVEHSGERVRNWCEEGGLGLGYLSEVWPKASFNPFPKGPDTTYFPVPFYLNPDKGYGFLLEGHRVSVFDFGKWRNDLVTIDNWDSRFDFTVFYGPGPLEIIEAQTAATGRITLPPPWVFAPMNATVEGEGRALEVARLVRAEQIPTGAIWSEDWWWRTEWEVNRDRYPNYEEMISELHAQGIRELSYFQPYISEGAETFKEGDAKGYFTKNRKGESYLFYVGWGKKAQLDLTNPEAREWWKRSFFQKAADMGVDGWMHDFGEYTPPDSVSFDGRSGWEVHNQYPLLWAQLGREFWDSVRPDGDYLFYIRGGWTGVQKYASVMWTGDQNSNFEKLDGLPSNLPAIMSVGISGHPIGSTDIAGYNCFVSQSTDQELFMRWTELGALLPVMRIHRGNDELCDMWSFDQDSETLAHYKKYAVLHTSLFPYLYTLAQEAADRGWPMVRHLSLHYPDDPATWRLDYEYLLGDRLLVAPVIERRDRTRQLYLPAGGWAHWWTGKVYEGPGEIEVPAGLGEVPLFARTGKVLPLYDGQIDTLDREDREDLRGFDDADQSIKALFYGEGADEFTLWDGTRIQCERRPGEPGSCAVQGAPKERTYAFDFR